MPNIKVIYWNVENFGDGLANRRQNYAPVCGLIAEVVKNVDADILCLMELKQAAVGVGGPLDILQTELHAAFTPGGAPGPDCDWYVDWVPGSLNHNPGGGVPFDPNRVGFTVQGRNEGYAVLWRQNLDKFTMQRASEMDINDVTPQGLPPNEQPIVGNPVVNTQSNGVQARSAAGGPAAIGNNAHQTAAQPPNTEYWPVMQLPPDSVVAAPGIVDVNGRVTHLPGRVLLAQFPLRPGDIIPQGTTIGPGGITLRNSQLNNVDPIVIPGQYTLSQAYTVPNNATDIIQPRVLSLVMTGRVTDNLGNTANYDPNGGNNWELLSPPSGIGINNWNLSRRPATCTIRANTGAGAAAELIPITFYHTPAQAAAAAQAMNNLAICREAYEAFNPGVGYIRNNRALIGGDLNSRLEAGAPHYRIFTNGFGAANGFNGGANFQGMRVFNGPPAVIPTFPPPPNVLRQSNNPENKSSIRIRFRGAANRPVLSNNFDHFRALAIDNIFYRGFLLAQRPIHTFYATIAGQRRQFNSSIYELMQAVSHVVPPNGVAPMARPAETFRIHPAKTIAFQALPIFAGFAAIGPLPPIPAGLNQLEAVRQTHIDLGNGVFRPALGGEPAAAGGPYTGPAAYIAAGPAITRERRAAEFVRLFVSDHMPVIFQMNL